MRKRGDRGWVRASVAVVTLASLGAAALTSVSLAAKGEAGEKVQSQGWVVSINHEEKPVPGYDELTYCTGTVLETMQPKITIKASSAGHHYYAYHIINPSGVQSPNTYAGFNGKSAVVGVPYSAKSWSKAAETQTNPTFAVGKYTLQLAYNAQISKGGSTTMFHTIGELILSPKSPPGC